MKKMIKGTVGLMLSGLLAACGSDAAATMVTESVIFEEASALESSETEQSQVSETVTESIVESEAGTSTSESGYDLTFSASDLEIGYAEESATRITLADNGSIADGDGVSIDGNLVTITAGGDYIIEGSLTDGQLVVAVADTEKVRMKLDGVDITSLSSAPIVVEEADKVWITLAEGSTNVLTDTAGSTSTLGEGEEASNIDGTIFSKADLALQGSGSLTINANNSHGIVSKDDLIITGGTYTITANGQGLSGKDAVKINGGDFTLVTQADAIQSDNAEDATRGFVYIAGGNFTIDSQGDGIQAETYLQIDGGSFNIVTGGGSEYGVVHTDDMMMGPGGGGFGQGQGQEQVGDMTADTDITDANTEEDTTVSTKGLKVSQDMVINGGDFSLNTADDSVHSNGTISLLGGNLTIDSGDDGIHADAELLLDGVMVNISQSYEGIEGGSITVDSGDITVVADDDGFNVSGGNDQSSMDRMGANSFAADSDQILTVNGGTIYVNTYGDGLDSNGYTIINSGEIVVSGPEDSGNSTLDANGGTTINGGIIMGSGSSGMAEGFSQDSTQTNVLHNLSTTYEAGSVIEISSADGTLLLTWQADKSFSSLIFSSADLIVGETYTVSVNGDVSELTLSEVTTSEGGFGGGGMPGEQGGPMMDGQMQEGQVPPFQGEQTEFDGDTY